MAQKQTIDAMWDDSPIDVSTEVNFIWSIANKLRGTYQSDKYKDVIIPMVIIRRFECALEPTKDKVVAQFKANPNYPAKAMYRISRFQFYNTSEFTLAELINDADNLAANFKAYLQSFSPNVQEIIVSAEKGLDFYKQIDKMDKNDRLLSVVKAFSELDLNPRTIDNVKMGYIFEDLIRRFSENAEAGDHYTGRDIIKLMVNILLAEDYKRAVITETMFSEECDCTKLKYVGSFQNGMNFTSKVSDNEIPFLGVGDFQNNMVLSGREAFSSIMYDGVIPYSAFYNSGSVALARRIVQKTGCPVIARDEENSRFWPVLYVGKNAAKDEEGSYVWKLRDELAEALDQVDLSEVLLYAQDEEGEEDYRYWFLNANPKIWSMASMPVGEVQDYTLYNDNGNKRRIFQNFLDAKAGDMIIGYESTPVKQVVAILKISAEQDGKSIYFEKVEGLSSPIDYATLKACPELEKMEYFGNPQGSLFKLTKGEYDFIYDMIRDENPAPPAADSIEKYDKEKFLNDVYMTEAKYDRLVAVLKKKKNIILQGAPGVGKTFAAKRLAYSIMGEKDDDRIEFVQFHQNYSYEDFMMGYKPVEDGFELKYGIFYRFCQKAANHPDKDYFFIIDEINRGNMSKIFGELLMLIEADYRDTKATLAYNGLSFSVPKRLHIIGMMNTADRSLAMIDYALRRRFSFFDMEPGFDSEGFIKYQEGFANDTFNTLIDRIKELNQEIAKDKSLGKGFCIGHSYFCNTDECTEEWMQDVVDFDVLPMLAEYWFDDTDNAWKSDKC